MSTAFLYDQQIEETPEFWTDETVNEYLENQHEEEEYYWDNDQELEAFSLECAFGPEEY